MEWLRRGALLIVAAAQLIAPTNVLARDFAATCERAIVLASSKYAANRQAVLERCVESRIEAGANPATVPAACNADSAVQEALAAIAAKFKKVIERSCGGADKHCGGDATNEVTPASLGFPASCPNFDNGACVNEIFDCADLQTCIRCVTDSAIDQMVDEHYAAFVQKAVDSSENSCQQKIARATRVFVGQTGTALKGCWLNVVRGNANPPCPSGLSSGKVDRANKKLIKTICKACGSVDRDNDGVCDSLGFDPQMQIGSLTSCPQVRVPNGADCGAIGTIDSLQKYVDCVSCVTLQKVTCIEDSGAQGQDSYPGECNPQSTLSLASPGTIGRNLQKAMGGSLGFPAPAGNLDVVLSSSDASKLLLSKTATGAGQPSITVRVGAGSSTIPTFYVQSLASSGTVQVAAQAPHYVSTSADVTLAPSAFWTNTASFHTMAIAGDTGFWVFAHRLDPATLQPIEEQTVRGGTSVDVTLTSSSNATGTTPSPLTFPAGSSRVYTAFHPLAVGTTDVTIQEPSGFTAPAGGQQFTATVDPPPVPNLYFCSIYYPYNPVAPFAVGKDLQVTIGVCRDQSYTGAVDVTVTSPDASRITLSKTASAAGDPSISFIGATGGYLGTFVVQGRDLATGLTITAQAAGHTDGTVGVDVHPSGFVEGTGSFHTTTISGDTGFWVFAYRLDPTTFQAVEEQPVRGGLSVDVALTSSSNATGTTPSPLTFPAETSRVLTAFHPVAVGTTDVTVQVPSGFTAATNGQQFTATVDPLPVPNLYFCTTYYPYYPISPFAVGKDLQVTIGVCRDQTYTGAVDVTVTSSDATRVTLSKTPSLAGDPSISFTGITGGYIGTFVVQGRGLATGLSLTAQASGHNDSTVGVDVHPSGFIAGMASFHTTTIASDTSFWVYAERLDPTTFQAVEEQAVRGGLSVDVTLTSSSIATGTTPSPLTFPAETSRVLTAFHPVAVGATDVTVQVPSGFTAPTGGQQFTATVDPPPVPNLYFCDNYYHYYGIAPFAVGRDLQVTVSLCRDQTYTGAVDVTVTSPDATRITLSKTATAAGDPSISFTGVTGGYIGTFVVQGRGLATGLTLSATASGHNTGTLAGDVQPSGFIANGDLSIPLSGGDYTLHVRPARLQPGTLNTLEVQPLRGGLSVNVTVVSGSPGVGTILGLPAAVAASQDSSTPFAFHPLAAGTSLVTITTPTGFSTSSDGKEFNVTVTP